MEVTARYDMGEQRKMLDATLAVERLLALDDLWTNYLGEADPGDRATLEGDLPTLTQLASDLHAALADTADSAKELAWFLESVTSSQVEEAFEDITREYTGVAPYAEGIPELLPDYDLRGAIIESCSYMQEHAQEAQAELQQKIRAIETGEFVRGDIPAALKCAGFLTMVGGGIAIAIASGGSALLMGGHAAVAVGGGIFRWDKSRCSEMLRQIGGWRR